jgi:N-acetylglucosamine kinase-like BadF-type ATPase
MSPDRSQQSAQSDLFWLGIDGGGTNTRAALLDRAGRVRGEGRADAANFLRIGLSNAVSNIRRAVEASLVLVIPPIAVRCTRLSTWRSASLR